MKLRGPATAALMSVTEALGPKFVVAQLHKHTATHKNPKVTAEALLFCASTVGEFGVETHDVAFNSRGANRPSRVQSRVQIRRGQVSRGRCTRDSVRRFGISCPT